jgi:hypothetical protein
MSSMDKELAEIGRRLQGKVREERRLMRELEVALHSADAEMQAEIERLQAAHFERRRNMMTSLGGLARSLGTFPTRQVEDHRAGPIAHDPTRRIAQDGPASESLERIAEYTRDVRQRG